MYFGSRLLETVNSPNILPTMGPTAQPSLETHLPARYLPELAHPPPETLLPAGARSPPPNLDPRRGSSPVGAGRVWHGG